MLSMLFSELQTLESKDKMLPEGLSGHKDSESLSDECPHRGIVSLLSSSMSFSVVLVILIPSSGTAVVNVVSDTRDTLSSSRTSLCSRASASEISSGLASSLLENGSDILPFDNFLFPLKTKLIDELSDAAALFLDSLKLSPDSFLFLLIMS